MSATSLASKSRSDDMDDPTGAGTFELTNQRLGLAAGVLLMYVTGLLVAV